MGQEPAANRVFGGDAATGVTQQQRAFLLLMSFTYWGVMDLQGLVYIQIGASPVHPCMPVTWTSFYYGDLIKRAEGYSCGRRLSVTGPSIQVTIMECWTSHWCKSYLEDRDRPLSIANEESCGVPHGPVLGPLLFNIYALPLAHLMEYDRFSHHNYSDDTNLSVSVSVIDCSSLFLLSKCINKNNELVRQIQTCQVLVKRPQTG